MEMKKSEISVNRLAAEIGSSIIVECDTIVSDSKPDLLKILQLDAEATILSKELMEGKLIVNGRVDYKVLYVPDSATGVSSLTATANFMHTEEKAGINDGMYADVRVDVEHIEFNLINSRKLSIKSVIAAQANIIDKALLSIPQDIDGEGIETKMKSFKALNRILQKNMEFSVEDQLILPPGKESIGSLLKSDVSVRNKDVKIINNKVVAKGEVVVCSLYLTQGDGVVTFVEHSIPFTEILDAEGITEEYFNHVDFDVADSGFVLSTDTDGDSRVIDCNVKILVHITSDEIVTANAVTDAYSTISKLMVSSSYFEIEELACDIRSAATIKGNIVPIEGIPPIGHIYNVVAKPYVETAVANGDKIVVEGSIDTYILYISSKDDSPVYNFKADVPFSISFDAAGVNLDNKINAKLETNHISYNMNAAGEIEVRIVLSADVAAYKIEGIDIISNISEEELKADETPSIILYFVQKGDTLWDIAKRYHTKTTYIEDLNELKGSSIQEGEQLLISKS